MTGSDIVILGLSITSAWGNGHATTYRGLIKELDRRGHTVTFMEREAAWYAAHRDLPDPPYCRTGLYGDLEELKERYTPLIRQADVVILGSYVRNGVEVGQWVLDTARGVKAFYDIDTPVTLAKLARGDNEYLCAELIPGFDLYLSFTGGPTLRRLEKEYGSPRARPLYCSVDPELHSTLIMDARWDLGYLGTYSPDRQPGVQKLLLGPAASWPDGRFVVAGAQFPESIRWPTNTARISHLPPRDHGNFYSAQRFTLNITRDDMIRAGWSPSVRLFEAAACGTPIISDWWPGLADFFRPGQEILIAGSSEEVLRYLRETPEEDRISVGLRAKERILASHTAGHRAEELVCYIAECHAKR
jgi:spore maturation protein CgeB